MHEQPNQAFRADMEGWAKVAPRLWVWDYTTDFAYYLMPFPNQRVIGPNIRFFVAHNVKGIFEEDVGDTPDSELASLGGYVMAKCLWNPNYDANRAMNEFLAGYYGRAATPIRAYIDLLHDYAERNHIHVRLYTRLDSRHLTDDLLIKANQHWQEAERLAAGRPEVLHRVQALAHERGLRDSGAGTAASPARSCRPTRLTGRWPRRASSRSSRRFRAASSPRCRKVNRWTKKPMLADWPRTCSSMLFPEPSSSPILSP